MQSLLTMEQLIDALVQNPDKWEAILQSRIQNQDINFFRYLEKRTADFFQNGKIQEADILDKIIKRVAPIIRKSFAYSLLSLKTPTEKITFLGKYPDVIIHPDTYQVLEEIGKNEINEESKKTYLLY